MQHTHHLTMEPRDPKGRMITIESIPPTGESISSVLEEHETLVMDEKRRSGNLGIISGSFSKIVTSFFIQEVE